MDDSEFSDKLKTTVELAKMRKLVRSGNAREIRLENGLSLYDVAGMIGVNPTSVYHWENGVCLPRGPHALKYARLLDALQKVVGAEEYHCRC